MPSKESEIGALWTRTSKTGVTYYTGTINGEDVVVFANKSDNPKAPTLRVYKSEPRETA